MKLQFLKQQLIKTAITCFVIIVICGGITFFTMSYDDSLAKSITDVTSQTQGNEAQYTQTIRQVQDSKDALEYYSNFSSSEGSDPENFRRESAKALLGKIKDQLNLVDLKFNMDQFQKKTGDTAKKHVSYYVSKVNVELTANSDTDILRFVRALSESFPGNITVTSYQITRRVELTDDIMKKLTDEILSKGIVDGKIEFEWGTILDNPASEKDNAPKPGQVPPHV